MIGWYKTVWNGKTMKLKSFKLQIMRNKITDSRSRLLENAPLFSLLLMHLDFYATDDIKTACAVGRGLYFRPSYLEKLYEYEVDLLLCHLVTHILMGDMNNDIKEESETYHHACDIVNNNVLSEYIDIRPSYPHFGKLQMDFPYYINSECADAMTVFSALLYRIEDFPENIAKRMLIDTAALWHKDTSEPCDAILFLERDKHELYYTASEKENTEENCGKDGKDEKDGNGEGNAAAVLPITNNGKLGELSMRALSITNGDSTGHSNDDMSELGEIIKSVLMSISATCGKGVGNAAALEKRILGNVTKTKNDWRKLLSEFVQEEVCDYSFSPPDRRFFDSPFMLPDFNDNDTSIKNILFMVDTSGSMCDDDVAAAYGEILGAVNQFGGKLCGKVGFFDTKVTKPKPFVSEEDIKKILPYGGGGTSFFTVFEYISSEMSDDPPSSIIILTDGDAEFPEESAAKGIPVLWLINNDYVTPPWGRCIRME